MNSLLKTHFRINPIRIKKLNGYDNFNYLIECTSKKYVLKTYSDLKILPFLEAETDALIYINSNNINSPKPIKLIDGSYVKKIVHKKKEILVRLLSYLKGSFVGEVSTSVNLTKSLGKFLANIDLKFQLWNNYIIKSKKSCYSSCIPNYSK